MMLQRQDTTAIREGAQQAGRRVMIIGAILMIVYLVIGGVYLWIAQSIPRPRPCDSNVCEASTYEYSNPKNTCESDMHLVFTATGILNFLMCIASAFLLCAQKEAFAAQAHQALVVKWHDDPEREEEMQEEQEEFEEDQARALKLIAAGGCCACLILIVSIIFFIYGIIQACNGTDENCNNSVTTYWTILLINLAIHSLKACCQSSHGDQARESV